MLPPGPNKPPLGHPNKHWQGSAAAEYHSQHIAKGLRILVKEKLLNWWTLSSWGARLGWLSQLVEAGAWKGPQGALVGLMARAHHVQDQFIVSPP